MAKTKPKSARAKNKKVVVSGGKRRQNKPIWQNRKVMALFVAIIAVVGTLILIRSFAASTPYTVEAETMSLAGQTVVSDSSASGLKTVFYATNGTATTTVNLTGPSSTFSLRAKGDQCQGSPQAQLLIDGKLVMTASVASTTYSNYSYAAASPLPSGSHTLSITYPNDYVYTHKQARKSCNRNLYLDSLTFQIENTTPTPTPTPSPTPSGKLVGHVRYMIDSNPDISTLTTSAQTNDYIVVQSWRKDLRDKIKAANPSAKVLAYLNVGGINAYQDVAVNGYPYVAPHGYASSGVHWDDAAQAGTGYNLGTSSPQTAQNGSKNYLFLHSVSTGLPFSFGSYGYIYGGNVGNTEYQSLWKQRALQLISEGWDGIFADDVNMTMKYHHAVSDVKEYPTDVSYHTAVKAFATAVFPAVKQAGGVIIPNLTGTWAENYPDVADQIALTASGGFSEFDGRWWPSTADNGYQYESLWNRARQSQKLMEDNNLLYFSLTPAYSATDERAAKFNYASDLLYANGHSFGGSQRNYTYDTTAFPFYSIPLGTPTSTAARSTSGIWKRDFSGAIVIVNPTASTQSIDLSSYGLGTRTLGTFTADVIAR